MTASNDAQNATTNGSRSIHPLILIAFGIMVGLLFAPSTRNRLQKQKTDKVSEVLGYINNEYVENISSDSLQEQSVQAILSTLDPHSSYLSASDLKQEETVMQGNFDGVGMVLRMIDDTVCVGQVIKDGPSSSHDILAGDRILMVDTVTVSGTGMKLEDVVQMLRGPRRSQVMVEFLRPADARAHKETIRRGTIATPSVPYYDMLTGTTGYIKLSRFSETSHKEICNALDDLTARGMKNLLLDLRGNSGGLLDAATSIADEFLPGRETIVYTQGAHQRRETIRSSRGGRFTEGPLTVLIDEWSASASEIVAGAVQDNDRGIIAGRRTFGKGLVQRQFYLDDGSAMLLTVARYYTPSGRCIQRPYDKGGIGSYYSDFFNRVADEVMSDTASLIVADSTPYYTLREHRTVYGGGGIYPDQPIAYHKDTLIAYYNRLISRQIIYLFSFDYMSRHAAELLKQYPTGDDFYQHFKVSDKLFEEMLERADHEGITRDPRSIKAYSAEMRDYIKAYIAESLYDDHTFYRIILKYDNDIKNVIQKS